MGNNTEPFTQWSAYNQNAMEGDAVINETEIEMAEDAWQEICITCKSGTNATIAIDGTLVGELSGETLGTIEFRQEVWSGTWLDDFEVFYDYGVALSSSSLSVDEGSNATYQVRMTVPPPATVTVTTERVSGDSDITIQSGASLVFAATNWSDWQTVTLAAAQDIDFSNSSATFESTTPNASTGTLVATENDDESLEILTDNSAVSVPEGSTSTFGVKLSIQPLAETTVTVTHISGDSDISVTGGASLTFTTGNWNTEQAVTLTAAEDDDWLNNAAIIRCASVGLTDVDVTATEADNETNPALSLPWEETFEERDLGDLAGQYGWTGGGTVQTGTVHVGSQALSLLSATASHTFVGAQDDICVEFHAKFVRGFFTPSDAGTAVAIFHIDTNGYLVAYSNATPITLSGTILSDDWHAFKAQLDYTAKTWTMWVDDTLLVDRFAFYSTQSDFLRIAFVGGLQAAFFDDIRVANHQEAESDTDGDGIPDTWEDTYYGGETNAIATNLCANGINTIRQAYIAGLNPTNANETFKLHGFGNVLQWSNVSDRVYTIYWTSNLISGFGAPWRSNITSGVFTDTLHEVESEGFYKLEVELE